MNQDTRKSNSRLIAAVDLGSNSFHMIVASINDNYTLKIIDKIKEMVRLGAGLDKHNDIREETQEIALDCLKRFSQRLENIHPKNIRITGTNCLRIANNSDSFIQKAKRVLNHEIDIISGAEEARLVYHGAVYSLAELGKKRLIIDIGGGSTEFIIGKNNKPSKLESLEIGCVKITELFFNDGIISQKKLKNADIFSRQIIAEIQHDYLNANWKQVVGTSGSIRSISKVLLANEITNGTITAASLKHLLKLVLASKKISLINLKGLNNERQAVFVGGLVVLNAAFKSLSISEMQVSDGALREGLLLDMIGRIQHKDIRIETVKQLSKQYDTRHDHAENIVSACLYFYKSLKKKWPLNNNNSLPLLKWAAYLHEIGLAISHAGYHKHSAYLVKHTDMPGFSLQEQQLLAYLIRYQRLKINPNDTDGVCNEVGADILYLLVIFRLAIILNRSIPYFKSDDYSIDGKKASLTLYLSSQWPDQNPLSFADLNNEIDYLKIIDFKLKIKTLNIR